MREAKTRHRVEVALLKLSDLDYVSHRRDKTLPRP